MRYRLFLTLTLATTFLFSCNFPGIFDSNKDQKDTTGNSFSENILLSVEKTGGFAGVFDRLLIYQNGIASFENLAHQNKKWRIRLTQSELDSLDSLMAANNFYDLSEEYIDTRVADAFYYSIYYKNNGDSNFVHTDNFASPERLQTIIAEIEALSQRIRNNGLDFSLEVSQSTFQTGDSVVFKLTFQNVSNQELTLDFSDGQIYNFSVYRAEGTAFERELIWSWASDKGFTQALWSMTLQPGESRKFEVTWHGKDNEENFVTGEFEVQATLVSNPGGGSSFQYLTVNE